MAEPISVTRNGVELTRSEVIEYLVRVCAKKKEIADYQDEVKQFEKEKKFIEMQMGKKEYTGDPEPEISSFSFVTYAIIFIAAATVGTIITQILKAIGLSEWFGVIALLVCYVIGFSIPIRIKRSDKKAHKVWVARAPEREKAKAEFDKKERERMAPYTLKLSELADKRLSRSFEAQKLVQEYESLLVLDYLAQDYRKNDVPFILLCYFINGRANTLTEAVNLFHQESHQMRLEELQHQQMESARRAHERMLAEQRSANRELNAKADEAVSAAKSAEFNSMLAAIFSAQTLDKVNDLTY